MSLNLRERNGAFSVSKSDRRVAYKVAWVADEEGKFFTPTFKATIRLNEPMVSDRVGVAVTPWELSAGTVIAGIHVATTLKTARKIRRLVVNGALLAGTAVVIRCSVDPVDHITDGAVNSHEAAYMQVLPLEVVGDSA
jgi:hypothetical protein